MASSILNFNQNRLITGINIIDGMLFFTDGHTEPKKINLDVFRAADHSTGTTSVYGRRFKERDITVIRPHPMEGISTSITAIDSNDVTVPSDAEKASVTTQRARILSPTEAIMYGTSTSTTLNMNVRGFYYIKSDYVVDEFTITTSGIKVETEVIGNNDFYANTGTLEANTRYYFVAFAYNNIGEEVIADNIETFKSDALEVSKTIPAVTTLGVFKQSPGKYNLKGKITDTGGSTIIEQGFYYILFDVLSNQVKPPDLYNYSGAIKVVGSFDENSGEYYYPLTTGELIYTQFFATNETGTDYGAVLGGFGVSGESTYLKPVVKYINNEPNYNPNKIALIGKVDKKFENPLTERGFIVSKSQWNSIGGIPNYEGDPSIHKIIDTTLNESNWNDEFSVDTINIPNFNLTSGDMIYVSAYADNGVIAYTDIIGISFSESAVTTTPIVHTVDVQQTFVSNKKAFDIDINVVSSGFPSGPTLPFVNCGAYIYKASSTDEFANLSATETQSAILNKFKENKAEKYLFITTDQVFGFRKPVTSVGEHSRVFYETGIVPFDAGSDYYIMAFCNNGTLEGHGLARKITLEEPSTTAPQVLTRDVLVNTDKSVTLRARLAASSFTADKANIYDAGFHYAARSESNFNFDNAEVVSLVTPGSATIENGAVSDINDYIDNNGGDRKWEIKLPYSLILGSTEWAFQAYVQLTAGGVKYPATIEGEAYSITDNGILTWKNVPDAPIEKVPIMRCRAGHVKSTTAVFFSDISSSGVEGARADSVTNKKWFYALTSDVVGATDTAKKEWIRDNGIEVGELSGPIGLDDYEPIQTNYTVESAKVTLLPNTSYSVISTASNGTTAIGVPNEGPGVGTSTNIHVFTTEPAAITESAWIECYRTRIEATRTFLSYALKGSGDLRHNNPVIIYFIKASDFTGTTAEELIADPDAQARTTVIDRHGNHITTIVAPLLQGTDYKAVAVVDYFYHGIKLSNIFSWKTTGQAAYNTAITTDITEFNFTVNGQPTFETGSGSGTNAPNGTTEVFLAPTTGTVKHMFGDGKWLGQGRTIAFNYKKVSGRHLIWFNVAPNNARESENRRWTMQIYNSTNLSQRITLVITQEGNGPKPSEEADGFNGLLGEGSGEGSEADGDPSWTISGGDIIL